MRVSLHWLKQLLRAGLDDASHARIDELDGVEAARLLTRAGLEVESITKFGDFSGVIVAEVSAKKPQPDAGKLTLVDVHDGKGNTQVVCGAPNVPEAGHRVLWARPGAKLPMGEGGAAITIAAKAVRGIESPGMLCAEDELGLGESHAGIIVLGPHDELGNGDDVAEKLGLPDTILELAVGPNRPDCLGHVGVARELAALMSLPWQGGKYPAGSLALGETEGAARVSVELAEPQGCSRYLASVLEDVEVGPSHLRVRLRLASLRVRSISNVVDVTNLMLLEHGQPMHAFDLDKMPGAKIAVRRARAGESIETLDGISRALESGDLLICDGGDRPIALAGVMGGKATEVAASTRRVLLECAVFDPASIRRTAKRLGLQSEASHRFERGVDPNMVSHVAYDAVSTLDQLYGVELVAAHDVWPHVAEPRSLRLRSARTRTITGLPDLSIARQAEHLRALGLDVTIDGDELAVLVPTFRPDLVREIDLVEEILRLEGYDQVQPTIPPLRIAPPELKRRVADRARDLLNALGLDEAITYAFVSPRELATFALPAPRDVSMGLANPLREEQSALRTTLLAGLVRAAARNLAHGVTDVRLFEVGHIFLPALAREHGLPEERQHVAGILVGRRDAWMKPGEPLDYADLRGIVDELGAGLQHALSVEASEASWLHPGVQGALRIAPSEAIVGQQGAIVGHLGELHPRVAAQLGLEARALVFELDLSALPPAPAAPLRAIPRFPAVARDLSFLVDERRSAAEIARTIASIVEPLLVADAPLEDYRDRAHVPAGEKSMLWSFTYRADDRTLTDAEVKTAHERLVAALTDKLGLKQR